MAAEQILILGVGCILYTDEGFGVRVVEELERRYEFPENVTLMDGGVLGLNLLGVISDADRLIVVDVIRNNGRPGDRYRLAGAAIPERVRAKNSLHQVDLLEALTMCQALDKVPETVIVGAEPGDIESMGIELTETLRRQIDPVIGMVLTELDAAGVSYRQRSQTHVSGHSFPNHPD
ncbi:MAG: HyaD/HybD family hydrogenase maturation endopeptidase [Thermodesulfobacteriota bacterium]